MAKLLGINVSNLQFTAGLLHDMGKLILDPYILDAKDKLLNPEAFHEISFEQRECEVMGFDHAAIGAQIMDQWQLPHEIVAAVRWHHEPSKADAYQNEVDIVHLADILAYSEGVGTGIDGLSYSVSAEAQKRLGLKKRDIEYVASHTLEKMEELESILT
jgi:putative nucleotidyltransferase with HDIG domain